MADFARAVSFVQQYTTVFTSKLSDARQLEYYAHYKQAVHGRPVGDAPSIFDPRGRAKFRAWENLGGLSASRAKQIYVEMLTADFPFWQKRV